MSMSTRRAGSSVRAGHHFAPTAPMSAAPDAPASHEVMQPMPCVSSDSPQAPPGAPETVAPPSQLADAPPTPPGPAQAQFTEGLDVLAKFRAEMQEHLSSVPTREEFAKLHADLGQVVVGVAKAVSDFEVGAVERIGAQIWTRVEAAAWTSYEIAAAQREMAHDGSSVIAISVPSSFEAAPAVKFYQKRKGVQHPPRPLPGGDIALIWNHDPADPTTAEFRIPENCVRMGRTGYRVEVPAGWLADVTVGGVAGTRVHVMTLCGATHQDGELVLPLRTNAPNLPMVAAGQEIARLHLRRVQPATVTWTNLADNVGDVSPDGTVSYRPRDDSTRPSSIE